MVDVQTSEVDAKLVPLNVRPRNFVCRWIVKRCTAFDHISFAKNQKYEHGGKLKAEIHFLCGQLMNR
jgi:hypothetical protein